MNRNTYKDTVKELFRSGKATEEQWNDMAEAVLYASEAQCDYRYITKNIDRDILPASEFEENQSYDYYNDY